MKIDVADYLGCLSDFALWSWQTISFIRAWVRFTHCRLCWPTGYVKIRRVIQQYGAIFSASVECTLQISHPYSISLLARRVRARIKSFRWRNQVGNCEDNLLGRKRGAEV